MGTYDDRIWSPLAPLPFKRARWIYDERTTLAPEIIAELEFEFARLFDGVDSPTYDFVFVRWNRGFMLTAECAQCGFSYLVERKKGPKDFNGPREWGGCCLGPDGWLESDEVNDDEVVNVTVPRLVRHVTISSSKTIEIVIEDDRVTLQHMTNDVPRGAAFTFDADEISPVVEALEELEDDLIDELQLDDAERAPSVEN